MQEFCNMWKVMSILQHNHKKTGKLTEKTWGRGWVVFSKEYKIVEHNFNSFCVEEMGELLAKNIGRTTRIQLDGQHPLFGEHLQN